MASAKIRKEEFADWMRAQIRMAGEELIRRSDQIDFSGWDAIHDIGINIEIPTYKEQFEAPEIEFIFRAYNKITLDALALR